MTTYEVHLDGYNLLPFLAGKEQKSPRDAFIYCSDDGDCMAVRTGHYKVVFAEQRATGLAVWREPLSPMRIPKFFDLRSDPFERGEESFKYDQCCGELQHRPGGREAHAESRVTRCAGGTNARAPLGVRSTVVLRN